MRPPVGGTCLAGLLLAGVPAPAQGQGSGTLHVSPARAAIGMFHRGVRLTVTGDVPTGTEVAIVVTGPAGDLHLRRLGRVWRVFWAPVESVTFPAIPSLYLLHTSTSLAALAPDSIRGAHRIGYASWRPTSDPRAADLFGELIRLKESEGLFAAVIGGIRTVPGLAGLDTVTTSLLLPARAPPATYRVELFGFRDGRLVLQRDTAFTIEHGPFNAFVSGLAHDHRLLYGTLAVGAAAGAGLLVGLAFGTVKGH